MDKYDKISKYRKQLEYIDRIFNILNDRDDGNLYAEFTEYDEQAFLDFIACLNDIEMNIEMNIEFKLKKLEEK